MYRNFICEQRNNQLQFFNVIIQLMVKIRKKKKEKTEKKKIQKLIWKDNCDLVYFILL